MKVAFYTLGCKVNQYESQVLRQQFENNGFEVVNSSEPSDVYIINSCTVTSTGDKKTRQLIHRARATNKNSIIVLTGCFPQAFPNKACEVTDADIITGTKDRYKIYDLVLEKLKSKNVGSPKIFINPNYQDKTFENMSLHKFEGKTRAFIKIQDGCNRFCSYCIIPMARGRIRSKKLEDIKFEVEQLTLNGHKEIVLTGINLSSYGQDINLRLIDAIKTVAEVNDVKRIRLSSLEPELLTLDDIKQLANINKFCPQFHLCLQSGCNQTLKRMNRHYTTNEYFSLIEIIRNNIYNPSITTDLIVGFPGETDEEFNETVEFVKKVNFSRIHVFSYSKRSGTKAALMPNQLANSIKQYRNSQISTIAKESQLNFLKSQIGLKEEVLFETSVGNNLYQGYSKNYTHVIVHCNQNLCGQIKKVVITGINNDSCVGNLL